MSESEENVTSGKGVEQKAEIRRRIYAKERLPAISTEMKELVKERSDLVEKRKENLPADQRKQVKYRLNFVLARIDAIKQERASLLEGRKTARAKLPNAAAETGRKPKEK